MFADQHKLSRRGAYIASLAFVSAFAPAHASRPSSLWEGARSITVHCIVGSEQAAFDQSHSERFCKKLAAKAAVGTTLPVKVVGFGDRALSSNDTVVLAAHGTVVSTGKSPSLIFTIRPNRNLPEQMAELFGSAPRLAPLNAEDRAINEALEEVLPWRSRSIGAQPIRK